MTSETRGNVFLLEDEALILLDLTSTIEGLGWKVAHVASDLSKALEIAEHATFDVAMLDMNVRGGESTAVARKLEERRIPFVITTGYDVDRLRKEFPEVAFLQKPYVAREIERALSDAMIRSAAGGA